MPLVPYRPECGTGRRAIFLERPLRPEFVDQLVVALARDGFRFRRSGERVLLPYLDIWPSAGAPGLPAKARFTSLSDFQSNTDWRLAKNIAHGHLLTGYGPGEGRRIAPPAALVRHLTEREPDYGRWPPIEGDAAFGFPWFDRFKDDCALLRAAVIRVEELPGP